MTLKEIKKLWRVYNKTIFAAAGMPLSTDVKHTRTRSNWAWGAWHDEGIYEWNYNLKDCPCVGGLILHEMIHQWQAEYLPDYFSDTDNDPHDIYFWGWIIQAENRGLKL